MSLSAYHELIARKRVAFEPRGLSRVPALNPALKDHQAHCVDFALRTGSGALFLDTGLGKTFCAEEWGRIIVEETNKPVLMLAPLAVSAQHQREGAKFGIDVKAIREPSEILGARVYVTNYERLERFDPEAFAGVILDECFAADTPIDVVNQSGGRTTKHIKEVRVGDKIVNAAGVDLVSDVHRREVPYAIRVRYAGREVTSSPNHPFFTSRGWVAAQDLEPGDTIVGTSAAMRMVQAAVCGEVCASRQDAVLRQVLLSEMADEPAGTLGESSHAGSGREAWRQAPRISSERRSARGCGDRPHRGPQSYVNAGGAREGLPPVENARPRSFRAWGQRTWFDGAAGGVDGNVVRQLDSGICFVTGSTQGRLSNALQDRLSQRRAQNRYRGGWAISPVTSRSGCQEGRDADFYGVDGIEVLEPGHPELDCYRDASGKLYFYDLGGTRHPSFSIHGALVHNSSILKSFTGSTTRALTEAFRRTPYRMACTATPAPNDHMELGQHSAFLGAMSSSEMLSRWFIADQTNMGRYRIKSAAVRPFWDWVASWARCVSKPSDLGFSDDGYILHALNLHRHIVRADTSADAGNERDGQGRLFRIPDTSATSIHKEKRLTIAARADLIAEKVGAEPDEAWVIWCDTDYEADALTARIPGAIEVRGSMSADQKEDRLTAFSDGSARILITKPSVAGYGLNWQHCARMAFVGLSFSYESFYQAIRRSWRFGQTRAVDVHVACADTEEAIWNVVSRKAGDHDAMKREMTAAMRRAARVHKVFEDYTPSIPAAFPTFLKEAA